jgi:hypothetical protein
MIHRANADFWNDYRALPANIHARADKQFALLKQSATPFPAIQEARQRNGQEIWSARVTSIYRVLAVKLPDENVWFWIGEHNLYDALTK